MRLRNLTGLSHARLRLLLLLFFLALAIPTTILLRQTYSQLKWEALHQQRVLAESLLARIDSGVQRQLQNEESRAFTDYRFLVVSGDPAAGQLQRSPLADYPLASTVPGLIGYFQVDSDGLFSSPLLPETPDAAARWGINDSELQRRQALAARVREILGANRLVSARRGDAEKQESGERDAAAPAVAAQGADVTGYSATLDSYASAADAAVTGQAVFDQLGKSIATRQKSRRPDSLGRIEDLQLEAPLERAVPQQQAESTPGQRAARKEYSALAEAGSAPSPTAPGRIHTFESAIDPFEFSRLDSGQLVLFRKVWRDDRRYIQGLLIDSGPWFQTTIAAAFHDSALSPVSELIVAWQGEVLAAFSDNAAAGAGVPATKASGTLLQRARLSAPLGDLELLITLTRLPAPTGAKLVNWLTTALALVLCTGFFLMYRLGARQIELARQQQDFVSAVSHELKTPLTSIRMYAEMLREGWAPEEKKTGYYSFIQDESERLSRLVNNVLQLARMTRNELQLDVKPVSSGDLMEALQSRIGSQIERAGFRLALDCAADTADLTLAVDRDAFIQIMINLVDNALKFSANAEIRLVEISCQQPQPGRVQFAVRDYGPGVPREQMRKIFELFYRPGSELTRETVGTGIGLALVQQLAHAMQGTVDVVNRQPGAEFRLLFPVTRAA